LSGAAASRASRPGLRRCRGRLGSGPIFLSRSPPESGRLTLCEPCARPAEPRTGCLDDTCADIEGGWSECGSRRSCELRVDAVADVILSVCAPRRDECMNVHVLVLGLYALVLMALGLWIGRRLRGASDFFVAGRQLGPGLLFSTMLAANIGAGSTVGATSRGY